MKNIVALFLGLISFLSLFVSLNHVAVIVDNCFTIWGIIEFLIYMFANYITFAGPASATAIFQNSRWPLLVLYIFMFLWEIVFIIANFSSNGFSLLPLLVYGFIAVITVLSFIKCFVSGNSYALELNRLELISREQDWSATDYLLAKREHAAVHKRETIIGLVIYAACILVSFFILYAEWFFLYK